MTQVRGHITDRISKMADRAADRLDKLVDSPNDFAALQAVKHILDVVGVGEEDRTKLVFVIFKEVQRELKPVLELIPEDRIPRAAELLRVADANMENTARMLMEGKNLPRRPAG
jgi:hypothetical protein